MDYQTLLETKINEHIRIIIENGGAYSKHMEELIYICNKNNSVILSAIESFNYGVAIGKITERQRKKMSTDRVENKVG